MAVNGNDPIKLLQAPRREIRTALRFFAAFVPYDPNR